jgi:hypothetical protein
MGPEKNLGTCNSRKILLQRFKALTALALASLLVWFAAASSHGSPQQSVPHRSSFAVSVVAGSSFPEKHDELSSRPVYPYSVIPGGIESASELREAVANDPVVAAHYAGFDFAHAHVVRLTEARSAFVSYRKGNAVFWTSKKVRLLAGETLITDGTHTSRTRCGNQVSDAPRSPVAPSGEPTPDTLATPLLTGEIELSLGLPLELPLEASPSVPYLLLAGGVTDNGSDTVGIIVPAGAPVVLGVGSGGENSFVPTVPPPVPTPTPEPATLLLTTTGLSAAWLARKLRKS